MKTTPSRLLFALASTAILLAGCGGGGGGSTPAPAPAPAPAPSSSNLSKVPVTVIDGVITNAAVCLDKNRNGACDSGEPSGRTDTNGNVILQVEPADVGKYPVLALVGTDAVDADHGPVTQAFVMKAPADQNAVISPLTTLVQAAVDSTGASTAAAETSVKAQLGINVSLFDDFTKSSSTYSVAAGVIARMVVVITQEQSAALASVVGTAAIDGTVITQAALDKAIEQKLLQNLTALATAASDPRILAAATPQAKAEAVAAVAEELVAESGLTATAVATIVAVNNQASTETPAEAPKASVTLRQIDFVNASNWFVRVFTSSAAQNTPDSSGNVGYVDRRARNVSGTIATWNIFDNPTRQSDVHWNGASWVNCGFNAAFSSSVRDAQGRNTYDHCDKLETGTSSLALFDVSGRKMIDVYNQAINSGYGSNLAIASAPTVLGNSAVFPAGSKVGYTTTTALTTAPTYLEGAVVSNTRADVASGDAAACAFTDYWATQTRADTLESIIAANRGTPCVYGPGTMTVSTASGGTTTVSTDRYDNWGFSSISIGTLGTAPVGGVPTDYFTTNTVLNAAFGTDNTVKYLSCRQNSIDGGPANCEPIGTGTYSIATLGDARVLSFNNPPAQANALTYNRVFVERAGKVHYGYRTKPVVINSARLNSEATDALFTQLGLPIVNPETPLALTPASYQGEWVVTNVGETDPRESTTIRLSGNGTPAQCVYNRDGTVDACTVMKMNPASGALTLTFGDGTFNGTLNFMTGDVTGTFTSNNTAEPVENIIGKRR